MDDGGTGIENRVRLPLEVKAKIKGILKIDGDKLEYFFDELEFAMGLYRHLQREDCQSRVRTTFDYYQKLSQKFLQLARFIKDRPENLMLKQDQMQKKYVEQLEEMAKEALSCQESTRRYLKNGRPIDRPGHTLIWGVQELYEEATGKQAGYSRGSTFHSLLSIVYSVLGEDHGDMTTRLRPLIAPFKNL